MALDFTALRAAAAEAQEKIKAQEKSAPKTAPKTARKSEKKTTATKATKTSAPHTDTFKTTDGVGYIILGSLKQKIEDYLKGRPDMAEKLNRKGKSIDKCCDYLYRLMLKRVMKEYNGNATVGIGGDDEELYSLAVHYYDESDEDLKKELEG